MKRLSTFGKCALVTVPRQGRRDGLDIPRTSKCPDFQTMARFSWRIFSFQRALHIRQVYCQRFPSDHRTHRCSTCSLLGTFNRSKRGHRFRRNHCNLSFFNIHNTTPFQRCLAASSARHVFARTLDRTTIDHRLYLLSLDCKHGHVK